MAAWKHYVYALTRDGRTIYIGKGSGYRLRVQMRKHLCDGHEVARFRRESDAYAFEVQQIAEREPEQNRHPGGNGARCAKKRAPSPPTWVREVEALGTRRYAARVLMSHLHLIDPSKVDAIRRVAYG